MKENNLFRLVELTREQISSFGLFSNVVLLTFLKFIMENPDLIGSGYVDYKKVYEFRKIFDQAKEGKRILQTEDFELIFESIDVSKTATTEKMFFKDLATFYAKLFTKETGQSVLFRMLNEIELPSSEKEMKEFFETVLAASIGDVRRTGEHTTNKSLRTLVSKILNVQENETFLDCFCGYSSMLLSLDNYGKYIGYDIDYNSYLTTVLVELMLGKKKSNVILGDFIESDTKGVADKVFSDAPLGLRFSHIRPSNVDYMDISRDLNVVAIHKGIDALKDGGVAVFTVPARALTSVSRGYVELRKRLAETGLKAVIELPPLWAGTSVQTNLIVYEKGYKGNVKFITAVSVNKYQRNRFNNVLSEQEIECIISDFRSDSKLSKNTVSVDYRDVICANTFAMSKYIPSDPLTNKYRDVKEIDNELRELYAKLNKNIM